MALLRKVPIVPKPFKPTRPFPLPSDAELVDVAGKPHVRLRERGKPALYPVTKDGRNCLRPSKSWYFECRDATGTVRRIKGFADLKATEQLAAETERKASRVRSGFTDPAEEHALRPLVDHLKDYALALEAKGGTLAHVHQTAGRITALLSGCGFAFLQDVDTAKASEWLTGRRRNGVPVEFPTGDTFTPGEAAKLLGISGVAVRSSVKRLSLAATGNGKARTFPRATVEALVTNRAKGCGPETVNHYIRAVRGFFRWLVKAKRTGSNPLEYLTLLNTTVDVRHARRELSEGELRLLFVAARASTRPFRGLSGTDRYHLYLMAAGTGFRASSLASLTPADFDWAEATVTLSAQFAKNRRTKVQPLPPDVANAIRDYLTGKPANAPVWGGTWASDHKGAAMIRVDLEAAGIAYAVEGPDGPEFADFHSLRHSFLTLGGRSGIDLRTLQELAGHSKPELTARYSHRRLYDLTGAVAKMPNLVLSKEEPIPLEIPLRMTGTDGESGVPRGVPTGYIRPHRNAPMCTLGVFDGGSGEVNEHLEMTGAGAQKHRPASIFTNEGGGGRTRNLRSDSPATTVPNPIIYKPLTSNPSSGCTAGCTRKQSDTGTPDAELSTIIDAWPTLPEPIKAAIRALLGSVK